MNKHIKIVAFIATIIILIGTFVFIGCKKEDLVKQDNTEKTRKSLNDDVIILDGVDHNSYFSELEVLNGIKDFLNKCKK